MKMFSNGVSKMVMLGMFGIASAEAGSAQPVGSPAGPSASIRAEASVEAAVTEFVQAFTSLDEARFDQAWTDDATLFFPMPVPGSGGGRFTGKESVLDVFHRFFASVRQGRTGPDYLKIKPEDMHVQDHGDTAIVTFHLTGEQGIARRTLVMRRETGVWRVAHMHASNMTLPVQAAEKPASE